MGAWGTGISSNDTYADIYGEFFDLYNNGLNVKEATEKLIAQHQNTINDSDDKNNFWFALAKAQWECKELDKDIFNKVKQIIDSGADIEVWRQLEANEKDIRKRKVVLSKFLSELETRRLKAKSRQKKKIRQPVFEKGDCITFCFENNHYGGAIVLEAIYDTEYGYNLIAAVRINQPTKPTLEDFKVSTIAIFNYANWKDEPNIFWYYPIRHKLIANNFETVGKLEVTETYLLESSKYFHCAHLNIYLISGLQKQFEFEKINPKPNLTLTINDVAKKIN